MPWHRQTFPDFMNKQFLWGLAAAGATIFLFNTIAGRNQWSTDQVPTANWFIPIRG